MSWLALTEYLANGFVMGMLYVLMALGLSLIFGMIGVINFCHGILFTLGAYATVSLKNSLGFGPALIISPMLVGALGMLIEVGFLRRLYRADPSAGLLLTFGLAMVLEQLVRIIWGTSGLPYNIPEALTGALPLGAFVYPKYRHFILLCAIAIIAGLWLFLEKTSYGLVIRAGARDSEIVRVLGIDISRVWMVVFGIGTGAAGIAGYLSAPMQSVIPEMGIPVLVQAFVVTVVGGMGSLAGAVVAGLLVGVVTSITVMIAPQLADAAMFGLMAVVLLLRPQGLFGRRGLME